MKWYWWALIALILIGIIVFVVRANNKAKIAAQLAANTFDPYKIVPINTSV